MNLTFKKEVKNLLKKYGISPSKKLGQNFLVDKKVVKKVIKAATLSPHDIVLEIGPGLGVLTQEIAKRAKRVIAIEKDPKLVEILKETVGNLNNIKIIQGDILKRVNWGLPIYWAEEREIKNSFKIVANLPYYIVPRILRKFLESEYQPEKMILMVQKEVAQRICAQPPKMNLIAVSVQFYAQPEIISYISKKSFWPQPKVDSAIIKIIPHKRKESVLLPLFFKIVKTGFSQPRKQLINNLSKGLNLNREKIKNWLLKNNIQPSQRAETLNLKDWQKLAKSFKIK